MIEISETAEALLPQLDAILFDMDGVLLDISASIRAVNCLAVPFFLSRVLGWSATDDLLTPADIELFKNAGGFNDDIDLSCAIVLHFLVKEHEHPGATADTLNVFQPSLARYAARIAERGGGLKTAEQICMEHMSYDDRTAIQMEYRKRDISRIFSELFGGRESDVIHGFTPKFHDGEGYWKLDRPLLDLERLAHVVNAKPSMKLGILTGRTPGETRIGLKVSGLEDRIPFEQCVTSGDAPGKPEPRGLKMLVDRLGVTGGIYIGDTRDDLRTVENYRAAYPDAPPVLGALVLTGPMGDANSRIFRRSQADVVASDVNEILRWIGGTDAVGSLPT